MEPHRITNFSFSHDMTIILVSLQPIQSPSYLKFYRKGIQGYELVSKIEHPHLGKVAACLTVQTARSFKFVSYSL